MVLLLVLLVAGAGQAAPVALKSPDRRAQIDEIERFVTLATTNAMRTHHIAGVTVAIVQGGQPLLLKGFGIASLSPRRMVDPHETLFRLGSLSKTFTWIALMQAVERGDVNLADPIDAYLPPRLWPLKQNFTRPIRVIDLMSHATGFEDSALGHLFVEDPAEIRTLPDYLVRQRPHRVREPGSFSTYSNYGAAIAGYIAARLEGTDFETLVEQRITGPLSMTDTTFREPRPSIRGLPAPMPSDLAGRLSDGFSATSAGVDRRRFDYLGHIAPASSASSTAADMARFMLMLLNDGRLGSTQIYGSETAKAFRTPIMRTAEGVNGWAHGFQALRLPGGVKGYGHGGATLRFMSNMVIVPERDIGIFVAANTDSGRDFVNRLPSMIIKHLDAAPDVHAAGGKISSLNGTDYAGDYLSTRRAYSGLEMLFGLFNAAGSVTATKDGRLIVNGESWSRAAETSQFRQTDDSDGIEFRMDAAGRVIGFIPANGTSMFERVSPWSTGWFLELAGLMTAVVALANLVFAYANRKAAKQTVGERGTILLLAVVSTFWLVALAAFAIWLISWTPERLFFNWPGPILITGSVAALAATIGSVALVVFLPLLLQRPIQQKGRFARWEWSLQVLACLIYSAFGFLLLRAGALEPWT